MEISSTKQYSVICLNELVVIYGKFEDVKGAIRSRKSKERQYNAKKTKGQTMIYKILHKKLNIEQHESHLKIEVNSGVPEGLGVPVTLVNHNASNNFNTLI